ncbi:MAG TPA: hypothetical protein VLA72_04205, partial [Anaerolineales bacterium]|nr:hypothetical protein [Anaerolineales bacterium]
MKFTVNTMAFGQDDYFYSATFEPTEIVKWNLVKGTSEVAFTADYTAVLRFSQNGQYVIFPNSDDSWCYFNCAYDIWDLNNKKLISNLTLGFLTVFDTDRNQLATSMFSGVSQETPILIIDMQSGEERTEINGGTNINFLSFSPQGKYILIVGKALMNGPYHLHIWDIITNTKVLDTEFQEKFINATFSPDEESVLIATSNPSSILWDLTNGKSEQYFTHDDQVQWASMSEDGMYIVSAGLDHTI